MLVGRQEGHPACKNLSGADLHMAQLMSLMALKEMHGTDLNGLASSFVYPLSTPSGSDVGSSALALCCQYKTCYCR